MADKKKKKKSSRRYDQGPPPAPASTSGNRPIGVGADYKPVYHGQTQDPSKTKVRYYDGDQMTEVVRLSPEDRADLQLVMRDLGLIGAKTKIKLGVWDTTSANAFKQVLSWANANGVGWRAALQEMQATGSMTGDIGGAAEPMRQATNPLDFQALGKRAAHEGLGRALTDQEQTRFVQASQKMEQPYLDPNNPTSEPTAAAWQDFATQQVRKADPTRFDSRSAVKVASVIQQMLTGIMPSEQQTLPGET